MSVCVRDIQSNLLPDQLSLFQIPACFVLALLFVFEFKPLEQKLYTVNEEIQAKVHLVCLVCVQGRDRNRDPSQTDGGRHGQPEPPSLFNYKEPTVDHVLIG